MPEASQAAESTPLPYPQRLERRRAPQRCLRAPQSLVIPGQGHPLSLRTLHLQAPVVPGETCRNLESGLLSPREPIPLSLPGLMTPGQQDPSLQKTPGRLPLKWTMDLMRSQTLTHPGKSTDKGTPRGILGLQAECPSWPSVPF
uniref:Psoriasis susceptibility 1 candidate 2 n=1 Tax=Ursus maritimus TaxID=29073 RepID=A0A452V1V7_URSMA